MFRKPPQSLVVLLLACTPALGETGTPPLPTVTPFDTSVLPAARTVVPTLGRRYAALTSSEKRSLRRGFKLPMEALTQARSVESLRGAAVLAVLPDPARPILAVKASAAGEAGNPFGGTRLTAFRDNPMRALGERLGATPEDASVAANGGDDLIGKAEDDPFGGSAINDDEDPFGGPEPPSEASADADGSDPFGAEEDEEDPFAGEEDPFGF